jgi:glycine oxidase
MRHADVLIVGGGVIGLSLAYELARQGRRVRVIDRGTPGQEASWAGAGILPPAVYRPHDPPLEQLTGLSHALHADWAERLRQETGVDNGYRRCGGIYVARDASELKHLDECRSAWQTFGIATEKFDAQRLKSFEPALDASRIQCAVHLPDETQIRNPRHLRALLVACERAGVAVQAGVAADDFVVRGGRLTGVRSGDTVLSAEQFCITGGAWSASLLSRLGLKIAIKPVRGQIVLLHAPAARLTRIVNEGPRYLVPRPDGRVLVGSTEEEAGFDKRNTAVAVRNLLEFGISLVPALADAAIERTWAGLRPATADGLPYLGRLPDLENAFIAAGHFRQGLHLSPGTAVVMSQLMRGEPTEINLECLGLERHQPQQVAEPAGRE